MIDIQIPQPDGAVRIHTFHRTPIESADDEKTLWKTYIHNVVGYTVDPKAPGAVSMISLSKAEWKMKMIEEHEADCIEAVRQFADYLAIPIGKPRKSERKTSNTPPEEEVFPAEPEEEIDQPAPTVESVMKDMIDGNINLTLDGKPELPVLNKMLASINIEKIDIDERNEIFEKINSNK